MPKELEETLKKQGKEKGLTGEHLQSYIFGTMNKIDKNKKRKKVLMGMWTGDSDVK